MPAEPIVLIDAARQLGAHALAAYGLLLAVALGAVALMFWWHGRRAVRPITADAASEPNTRWVIAGFTVGLGLVLLAAQGFAEIAEQLGPGRLMGLADQALTDAIRSHTPAAALSTFAQLTHLGDPKVLIALAIAVAAVLAWSGRRALAGGWLLALAGNALLNPLLKQIFARARPLHDDALAQASGYSFPSGHSSGAVVFYGMLMYVALLTLPRRWHLPVALVCVAVALTTALSRVFIQVHFASDVAAGMLSGGAWLGVSIVAIEAARRVQQRRARRAA